MTSSERASGGIGSVRLRGSSVVALARSAAPGAVERDRRAQRGAGGVEEPALHAAGVRVGAEAPEEAGQRRRRDAAVDLGREPGQVDELRRRAVRRRRPPGEEHAARPERGAGGRRRERVDAVALAREAVDRGPGAAVLGAGVAQQVAGGNRDSGGLRLERAGIAQRGPVAVAVGRARQPVAILGPLGLGERLGRARVEQRRAGRQAQASRRESRGDVPVARPVRVRGVDRIVAVGGRHRPRPGERRPQDAVADARLAVRAVGRHGGGGRARHGHVPGLELGRAGDVQPGAGGQVERHGLEPCDAVIGPDEAGHGRGAEQRPAVQLGRAVDGHAGGDAREVEPAGGHRADLRPGIGEPQAAGQQRDALAGAGDHELPAAVLERRVLRQRAELDEIAVEGVVERGGGGRRGDVAAGAGRVHADRLGRSRGGRDRDRDEGERDHEHARDPREHPHRSKAMRGGRFRPPPAGRPRGARPLRRRARRARPRRDPRPGRPGRAPARAAARARSGGS